MSGSFVQELKRRNVFRVAVIYNIVDAELLSLKGESTASLERIQLAATEALPYLGEYDFRENVEN